jgi:putative peptidoglycan lipid II flippase
LTRAAVTVALATLLSRLLGYVRDALIAWCFGTGFGADAFLAAFRIPTLFRRLFAEGTLSSAFVPVLTETLWKSGHAEARSLASASARLLAGLLIVLCLAGMAAAPWIVRVMTPGFAGPKLELTVSLTRLMFPYLFAAGMGALCMGALNVFGSFAAPALAPALLNIAMIVSLLSAAPLAGRPEYGLALAVLVGGAGQLALQLPFLARHRLQVWRRAQAFHPALKRVARLMVPAVLGGAVYQINVLVGTVLASFLPEGSVSYLYYAERLLEFPLGIVAMAGATAVLPSLAREAAAGDAAALRSTFGYAFRMVSFLTLPAMAGLILLGEPMVALLFQRGEFGPESARLTSRALSYYALGLWAFSAVRIVVAAFFALQDSRTPVRVATVSILANVVLGAALMRPLAHGGIALAAALASFLNLALLLLALRRKLGAVDWRAITVALGRTLLSTLVMAAGVGFMARAVMGERPATAAGLAACMFTGVLIYAGAAFFLRSPELAGICGLVKRSLRTR